MASLIEAARNVMDKLIGRVKFVVVRGPFCTKCNGKADRVCTKRNG